jgi:phosphoglycolate phosphatase-like HAD superfamily hydrolase
MMQALLFDLDGTLIDSSDDLTRALNAAFAEHGLGALSREQAVDRPRRSGVDREALRTSGQRHLVADSDRLLGSFSQCSHEIYDLGWSSTRAYARAQIDGRVVGVQQRARAFRQSPSEDRCRAIFTALLACPAALKMSPYLYQPYRLKFMIIS